MSSVDRIRDQLSDGLEAAKVQEHLTKLAGLEIKRGE